MMDLVRPRYKNTQFMELVDQIYPKHPDLSNIISQYKNKFFYIYKFEKVIYHKPVVPLI